MGRLLGTGKTGLGALKKLRSRVITHRAQCSLQWAEEQETAKWSTVSERALVLFSYYLTSVTRPSRRSMILLASLTTWLATSFSQYSPPWHLRLGSVSGSKKGDLTRSLDKFYHRLAHLIHYQRPRSLFGKNRIQ